MRPGQAVEQRGLEKQREQRQDQNDRRQHLARKHNQAQGHAAGIVAGEGIGDCGGERQSDDGRAEGHCHTVEEIVEEGISGKDLDKVSDTCLTPFGRNLVRRLLVGERHAEQPQQRQKDGCAERDENGMRQEPGDQSFESPRRRALTMHQRHRPSAAFGRELSGGPFILPYDHRPKRGLESRRRGNCACRAS